MLQKEIKRIKVLELLVNGRMTNQEAAESLGLCRRQIIRLRKKYTTQGEMGLIHGNRDRHPQHRIGEWIRHDVLRAQEEGYTTSTGKGGREGGACRCEQCDKRK